MGGGARALVVGGVLLAVACAPREAAETPADVQIHTSDVVLFWTVLDRAEEGARVRGGERPSHRELARALEEDYLAAGTRGLRDFIPGRILGGDELARRVLDDRARYEAVRSRTSRLPGLEPEIRSIYRRLRARYPDAVLPHVYFVIGRFNSGGTTSARGLLIGAEMMGSVEAYPALVAHELVHFQQPTRIRPTLLTQALHEGTAEFLGERLSGQPHRSPRYAWGLAHEAELWEAFKAEMDGRDFGAWLYGGQPEGVPADLGYFLGYRIVQAYWEQATDTVAALGEILRWRDAEAFLEASGYAPGDLSAVLGGARRALSLEGRVPGIDAEAAVSGPEGSFRTRVVSQMDGGAWMIQPPEPARRVSGHGPWGLEERISEVVQGAERAFVRAHELHALALFPESRLMDPTLLGPVSFQGREALGVRWRATEDHTLVTFYAANDTLPLGVRVEWTDPMVEAVFEGWDTVEDGPLAGTRIFRNAVFTQGDEVYEYRYDRVELGPVPSEPPGGFDP